MMESANDAARRRRPIPLFETGPAPVAVRIQLLGGFRVLIDERVVPETAWRLGKARSLVQLLCLAPGHRLHREQIMDLFWPDLAPKAAAGNFYQVVHAARRALSVHDAALGQPAPIIHLRQQVVCLEPPGSLWIDIEAFAQAAAAARQAPDTAICRAAIDAYRGDLLPEHPYDEWLIERRQALRETVVALLFHEARLREQAADYSAARAALRRIIEQEPAYEQAHADLMRLLALTGQPALALDQYRQLRETLDRELGEEPGEAITQLSRDIAAGRLAAGAVNDAGVQPARGNLRAPLTSFVGRRRELASVLSAVRRHRIVTLTGAGGCGKTRLALAAADALTGSFPDGVWLVELAALAESGLILRTVTTALGVTEQPERSLEYTLIDALRQRRLLIVLDNCEHLLDACAALSATILEACPRVHILATSRERLRVAGEQVWRVPSLSLPEAEAPLSVEQLEGSEAIQLFVERARLAQPDFAVDTENAGAVAAICHRLDGLPLAIELAAAWLPLLPPAALLKRLERRLTVLVGGPHDLPARQQTMRDAIAWSYDLLDAGEQALLRQQSVFAGDWKVETAETISTDEEAGPAVLHRLAALVDKSLLRMSEDRQTSGAEPRLTMLETIREYALERLREAGEEPAARDRHGDHYQALAERVEAEHQGAAYESWLDRLQLEHDNLRAALEWRLTAAPEAGLRLAGDLWRYWRVRGHHAEGRHWLEQLLARAPAPAAPRARALIGIGVLAVDMGDSNAAWSSFEEGLSIARSIGDRGATGLALMYLGTLARREGLDERARAFLEEALSLLQAGEQQWEAAISLRELGNVARSTGDYPRARTLLEESLALARSLGSIRALGWAFNDLALLARFEGDHGRAMTLLEESVAHFRAGSDTFDLPWALARLGDLARIEGDVQRARDLLTESVGIFQRTGMTAGIVTVLYYSAMIAARQGRHRDAVRLLAAAATHDPSRALLYLPEHVDYAASVDAARAALGDGAFAQAWDEGGALTLGAAIASALSS